VIPETATEVPVRPPDVKNIYPWVFLALAGFYAPIISKNPLHTTIALLFILFIPSYLLVAALFPAGNGRGRSERIALSFGVSLAIVLLSGIVLNYTPPGIRLDSISAILLAFSLAVIGITRVRGRKFSKDSRCMVPFATYLVAVQDESSSGLSSRFDRILSIVLIAAVLVAIATTVFIIIVPKEGEKFTEFYILGPRGKAADYPTEFMSGTPQTVIIGIGNHEYRDITYTVETFAVVSSFNAAANQSTIVSATLLDRFSVTVPHNQTVEQPYTFRIMDTNTNRIEFLLFTEDPPDSFPKNNISSAGYRNLHLWLRVH